MSSNANPASPDAAVLGASGIQTLHVDQAMDKVRAALSTKGAASRDVYAVLVYGKNQRPDALDHFAAINAVLKAYWKGWRSLSRLKISPSSKSYDFQRISVPGSSDVCVYWGSANAKDAREKINTSPGVYLILSHLNASLLGSMELPQLPEQFRESPLVIQFKTSDHSAGRQKGSGEWNPWNTLTRQVASEHKAEETIQKDTLAWRKEFMSDYECWTSAEVARQNGSTAKNAAAIASRWAREGKIFSVKFEGKTWFPRFQFQDGSPIPPVADIIKAFPKHSTGWDLAFFFTNPNSYIAGRKPIEILRSDPERVVSLARAFANPADAF
jgi:hypothetical protein